MNNNQEHPIKPPQDLVQQWSNDWLNAKTPLGLCEHVAIEAARWGADQELEACVKWIKDQHESWVLSDLRAARRPSLKQQALGLLNEGPVSDLLDHEVDTIRRALEALPDE